MLGKLGDLESWVDDLLQPGCGLTNQMLGSGESGEFQFLERTIWLNSSGFECEEKSPAPNHMHFQAEKRCSVLLKILYRRKRLVSGTSPRWVASNQGSTQANRMNVNL